MTAPVNLEMVLTGQGYADLPASPLQLAIARAADGRDLDGVLDPVSLRAHFGVDELPADLGAVLVVLICGVRSGKSFLAACAAIRGCLTVSLAQLKRHEVARFAIVAPTVDNANATFRILAGIVSESPVLSRLVQKQVDGELLLRRLDGRIVEIVVVAAHRGAITLRSRWLLGFCIEEVAGFGIEVQGAVVTGEELLRAGEPRLLPGAQGWIISSPFGPQGLLWEFYKDHFGKPGRVLVVHAPTLAMNPSFDPAQVEAVRRRDPDTAAREYDAQWLDASTSLLTGAAVDRCSRRSPLVVPYERGHDYFAFIDPATRGNAFTLIIATRAKRQGLLKTVVVLARQWVGSKTAPLSPKRVLAEIVDICRPYKVDMAYTDQHAADAYRDIATDLGFTLVIDTITLEKKNELYQTLALAFADERIEVPADPVVRADLLSIRKIATQSSVRFDLPVTADKRHADYCQPIAMAATRRLLDPEEIVDGPPRNSPEWQRRQREDMAARLEQAVDESLTAPAAEWWEPMSGEPDDGHVR